MTIPVVNFELPYEILLLGIITGLTYSVLGLGLTLVYKSSRVLNFAQGEMGALPALVIPVLVLNYRWNYWLTLLVALAGAAMVGGLLEFLVMRRLERASRLTALVATIGGAQMLFVFGVLLPKGGDIAGRAYPTPFSSTIHLGRLVLGPGQILILVTVPIITLGLSIFLRRSRLGRASRASAENAEAARLAGVPTSRVSFAMWSIAGLLAGVAAILIGPTRPLAISEALGPALMLRALGAAMLGGLTSFAGVFAGGIAIGVVEALVLWNYPIGGVLELVVFVIILVSLLLKRRLGQMARGSEGSSWSLAASLRPLEHRIANIGAIKIGRRAGIAALAAVGAFAPLPLSTSEQFFLSGVVLFALVGLSLVVLTGYAGQVSLGQFAFVGVGAAVGGRLYQLGWPHGSAIIGATAVGAVVALVVGLPALRIRGLFLAVTTLGFSVAASGWLFSQDWLVHTSEFGETSLQIPRPHLFGLSFEVEIRYYWLCLASLIAVAALVTRLRRTGIGRAMIAVRDNEPSAASLAISPRRVKLIAFVISGMIAGFGGFLYGGLLVSFSSDPGSTFGPEESIALVVMAVFGGVTTVTGAIVGALWVRGIPRLLGETFGILSSGVGLLAVLTLLPGGLASLVFELRDRVAASVLRRTPAAPADDVALEEDLAPPPAAPFATATDAGGAGQPIPLRADGVTVRYGGVEALSDVSIEVRAGEILGIMGPNGAGKTTLFDVLSGQQRPARGTVHLGTVDVTRMSPQRRAQLGLGRSFQQARLFEDLTLLDAVKVALERREPSGIVSDVLGLPRARRRERHKEETAAAIIDVLGLHAHARRDVGELSTGTRRLAELACVVALGASVLLLDEPTAGFNADETASFNTVLQQIQRHLGATIVVIDHDVPMMSALADRLYVLAVGKVIAEGPPSILHSDERVIDAYIGVSSHAAAEVVVAGAASSGYDEAEGAHR